MEQNKRRQVAKISVFITSVFVIFLSITYAFINMTLTGTKRQVVTAGTLELEFTEGESITLENAMPMYDEVGMIQDSFDFQIKNVGAHDTAYSLKLIDITDSSKEKLETNIVHYGLTKNGENTIAFLSDLKSGQLDTGVIPGGQTSQYNLRLWIDSEVTDNNKIERKTLSYRINLEYVLMLVLVV